MNKKLLELLNQINAKKAEVQNLAEAGNIEAAQSAKDELIAMQNKFNLLKDVLDPDVLEPIDMTPIATPVLTPVEPKNDSVAEFANAARRGFRNGTMTEGTPADGGYTVPEDIQTRINEYREAQASLISLVDVENVTTNKGQRTFKKRTQQTGFVKVAEGGKIGAGVTPQFERLSYEIEKYAGYFPVTNELLSDSDANIVGTLTAWIGNESRITRNKLILTALGTKEKTPIKTLDDIKKALNVTLGQAFKPTSRIVTNDDGLQWLDTLKNEKGEYLLQPSPVDPMQLRLCAGATTIPVTVIPNADLPTAETKIPIIIGDLKEAVKFFDRNQMSIMSSNIASIGTLNAYEMDMTLFRAIEREDCVLKDKEAFVYGEFDTSTMAAAAMARKSTK